MTDAYQEITDFQGTIIFMTYIIVYCIALGKVLCQLTCLYSKTAKAIANQENIHFHLIIHCILKQKIRSHVCTRKGSELDGLLYEAHTACFFLWSDISSGDGIEC